MGTIPELVTSETPESNYFIMEILKYYFEAFFKLGELNRQIYNERFVDELSISSIAEKHRLSVEAVNGRIYRSKIFIMREIKGCVDGSNGRRL